MVSGDGLVYAMGMSLLQTLKKNLPNRHPLRLALHRTKAFLAALRYGFPARKLTIIGITGTDGKTTTVGMIAHILHAQGIQVGALSTAFFRVRDRIEWNATQKTSPSPFTIQKFLCSLVQAGCTHAVLECSSHGLVQGRVHYTWPAIAGLTNVTPEHLDYHGSMEQYRKDKGLLFRSLRRSGTKVLNADDATFAQYSAIRTKWTIAYSVTKELPPARNSNECAFWASSIQNTAQSLICKVHGNANKTVRQLRLNIPGEFNIENALCALGCAHAAGVSESDCLQALQSFAGVPGRLERVSEGQAFPVFIDFTVTPASYQKTLGTLKGIVPPGGRLLVLAGSCGDRMREKRPEVGRICSQLADVFVVTNEDPYTEDPDQIINQVWQGIDTTTGCQCQRIADRKEAMKFLLSQATPMDIVVFCGKGSDTTMWLKHGQVPWNEREITRELLRELPPRKS